MKYKVGDKVLVEGVVKSIHIHSDIMYTHEVKIADVHNIYFLEDELMDATKTYENGLADAWELAKKLYNLDCNTLEDIYGVDGGFYGLMKEYTAQQALDKIEAYEKSQQIQVGDVVYADDEPDSFGVVTWTNGKIFYVMWDDGSNGMETNTNDYHKTGRHIDISSILEQIRGNE